MDKSKVKVLMLINHEQSTNINFSEDGNNLLIYVPLSSANQISSRYILIFKTLKTK